MSKQQLIPWKNIRYREIFQTQSKSILSLSSLIFLSSADTYFRWRPSEQVRRSFVRSWDERSNNFWRSIFAPSPRNPEPGNWNSGDLTKTCSLGKKRLIFSLFCYKCFLSPSAKIFLYKRHNDLMPTTTSLKSHSHSHIFNVSRYIYAIERWVTCTCLKKAIFLSLSS